MDRLVIAAAIVAVVGLAALIVRRRRVADPPTQRRHQMPSQLDRGDFCSPERSWLVAVFTSATCDLCRDVAAKALVLDSDEVAVDVVDFDDRRGVHDRYAVTAVPTLVIADRSGVVHEGFLGPVTATDLWAAVARARDR